MAARPPDADPLSPQDASEPGRTNGADGLSLVLARQFVALRRKLGRPIVVGLCGSQGSGKSTISRRIGSFMKDQGLSVEVLSIDDLYLSRADRLALAETVHPLLATRGPPGTHDVGLGIQLLDALSGRSPPLGLSIPVFDKLADTLRPRSDWLPIHGPVDVVIFEGWCVGARPQGSAALRPPVNDLERTEDPEGAWRMYANQRLESDYAELFSRLDLLVMLKAPSFEVVFDWRATQERELLAAHRQGTSSAAKPAGMGEAELRRFLQHYQRLTESMLEEMPGRCDILIELAPDHRPVGVRLMQS